MRHATPKRPGRRVTVFVALLLVHAWLISNLTLVSWAPLRLNQAPFVSQVFFINEVEPKVVEPAASSPLRSTRKVAPPVRSAPITLPPEPATNESPPPEPPAIDWAREAELSASRQLQNDDEARRRAAPFSHDFSATAPTRPAPQFRWNRAHTERVQPLEGGGTLIWLNDRCAVALAGMIFPVCAIGKIPARGDLFEHMDDPPVLGEAPRPP